VGRGPDRGCSPSKKKGTVHLNSQKKLGGKKKKGNQTGGNGKKEGIFGVSPLGTGKEGDTLRKDRQQEKYKQAATKVREIAKSAQKK